MPLRPIAKIAIARNAERPVLALGGAAVASKVIRNRREKKAEQARQQQAAQQQQQATQQQQQATQQQQQATQKQQGQQTQATGPSPAVVAGATAAAVATAGAAAVLVATSRRGVQGEGPIAFATADQGGSVSYTVKIEYAFQQNCSNCGKLNQPRKRVCAECGASQAKNPDTPDSHADPPAGCVGITAISIGALSFVVQEHKGLLRVQCKPTPEVTNRALVVVLEEWAETKRTQELGYEKPMLPADGSLLYLQNLEINSQTVRKPERPVVEIVQPLTDSPVVYQATFATFPPTRPKSAPSAALAASASLAAAASLAASASPAASADGLKVVNQPTIEGYAMPTTPAGYGGQQINLPVAGQYGGQQDTAAEGSATGTYGGQQPGEPEWWNDAQGTKTPGVDSQAKNTKPAWVVTPEDEQLYQQGLAFPNAPLSSQVALKAFVDTKRSQGALPAVQPAQAQPSQGPAPQAQSTTQPKPPAPSFSGYGGAQPVMSFGGANWDNLQPPKK